MQLKLFVLPIKNLGAAEAEMNAFLRGHRVLTWNNAAFSLQCAPDVTGTFTNLPGVSSPCTNPITGAQQYFRLIAN